MAVLEPGHSGPMEERARSLQRMTYMLMATIPLVLPIMCVLMNFTLDLSIRKTMELMKE